jgi:hypothetical protein
MTRTMACLLVTLAGLVAPTHAEDGHVGLFKNVTGTVHIVRKDITLPAAPGALVFISDRLVSGAGATAGVVFKDGTLLTVGPAAELVVRDYAFKPAEAKYDFSVYLAKGSAIYSSGRIGKLAPASVKVDTPTATVGVRGTRFIIEAP